MHNKLTCWRNHNFRFCSWENRKKRTINNKKNSLKDLEDGVHPHQFTPLSNETEDNAIVHSPGLPAAGMILLLEALVGMFIAS